MRESIGTAFMFNFILLFIFLVFAFLAGTFSYYKAYRINNNIVHAIEKFEGYNAYSEAEINNRLGALGYDISQTVDCPTHWKVNNASASSMGEFFIDGHVVHDGEYGYCIYEYDRDNNFISAGGSGLEQTDNYTTYGVLTYIKFRFPVVEYFLRIPVFSRTNRLYCFECR